MNTSKKLMEKILQKEKENVEKLIEMIKKTREEKNIKITPLANELDNLLILGNKIRNTVSDKEYNILVHSKIVELDKEIILLNRYDKEVKRNEENLEKANKVIKLIEENSSGEELNVTNEKEFMKKLVFNKDIQDKEYLSLKKEENEIKIKIEEIEKYIADNRIQNDEYKEMIKDHMKKRNYLNFNILDKLEKCNYDGQHKDLLKSLISKINDEKTSHENHITSIKKQIQKNKESNAKLESDSGLYIFFDKNRTITRAIEKFENELREKFNNKTVFLSKNIVQSICEHCHGWGKTSYTEYNDSCSGMYTISSHIAYEPCKKCQGDGIYYLYKFKQCDQCQGTSYIDAQNCNTCINGVIYY